MDFFNGGIAIIATGDGSKLKHLNDGFVSYKHTAFHKTIIDELEWCGLLVFYCGVFISCLDSYSDGTHSPQMIHWWASDVMLLFNESILIKQTLLRIECHFWVNYTCLWWYFHSVADLNVLMCRVFYCKTLLFNPGNFLAMHIFIPVSFSNPQYFFQISPRFHKSTFVGVQDHMTHLGICLFPEVPNRLT